MNHPLPNHRSGGRTVAARIPAYAAFAFSFAFAAATVLGLLG